jgi:hypothetical protein
VSVNELRRRPRTPIKDARDGDRIKVVGRLRAANGSLATAPLTGASCLWYLAAAQIGYGLGWGRGVIAQSTDSIVIEDDTGSGLLDMSNARVEMRSDWRVADLAHPKQSAANVRAFLESRGVVPAGPWPPMSFPAREILARFREVVLEEGDVVAVTGVVGFEPDPTAYAGGGRLPAMRVVIAAAMLSSEPAACA